ESEVAEATSDLLIEAAHFDPVSVARTARRHRIPSEAGKRFERGVDPQLPRVAARRAVELLLRYGGGTADDVLTDVDHTPGPTVVELRLDLPARLVGVPYTAEEVVSTLTDIGCTVDVEGPTARVTVPSWRPDLVVPVDLVEEVARLRGYDAIPSVVPQAPAGRGLTPAQVSRRAVADALAAAGFVEVLSYPFVGTHQHDALALPPDDARRRAVRLVNPLSDELPEMRTHLLPTLLETVRRNVGRGLGDLALVETGLVTRPEPGARPAPQLPGAARPDADALATLAAAVPPQPRHVAGVLTGLREPAGWWGPGRRADHTDAIDAALLVGRTAGVRLTPAAGSVAPWHPGRTAELRLPDGSVVGHAGELHPRVLSALELPPRAVAFELDLDAVLAAAPTEPVQAVPVSTFPPAKEDIALVVAEEVPVGDLFAAVHAGASASAAGRIVEEVRVFDVYRGAPVPEGHKSVAFSLRLRAADRTLTSAEAAAVREAAVAEAHRRHGATLRA
ncbi:MAG: phenylalanine--tRNA ligase subunit beta, partial [Actinotalea sp.]|nr:phenylalanine--tRNA ligase subunit beta [Actinotalea sp.]